LIYVKDSVMGEKQTEADSFRSSLEDVVTIAEKLSGHVETTADLAAMCRLAIKNDGQLRLLMEAVRSK
jgi:hypothetical protein